MFCLPSRPDKTRCKSIFLRLNPPFPRVNSLSTGAVLRLLRPETICECPVRAGIDDFENLQRTDLNEEQRTIACTRLNSENQGNQDVAIDWKAVRYALCDWRLCEFRGARLRPCLPR